MGMVSAQIFKTLTLLVIASGAIARDDKGLLHLDSLTFDKVVGGNHDILVRFDREYSHGDENDAFKKVTSAITGNSALSLLVGTVGIQEWGDKNNFDLAEKHKVSTSSDWPVYMFFPAKSKKGVKYEQDKKSKDAILRFLREQKVPIRLAGRIDQLDALAKDFMANKDGRAEILKKAEAVEVGEKRTATKKLYLSIMQKIIDEGNSYVKSERKRLNNLLKEKDIKPEKKGQTEKRANILQAFADEATKSK